MTSRKIFVFQYTQGHIVVEPLTKPLYQLHVEKGEGRGEKGGGEFGLLGARIHRLGYPRGFPLGLSWRWIQIPSAHWTTYSGQFRAKPGIPPLPAAAASQALLHHLCLPRLSRTGQKSQLVCVAIQFIERERREKKRGGGAGWGQGGEGEGNKKTRLNGWFLLSFYRK